MGDKISDGGILMDMEREQLRYVIAVDPGTEKCGLAVVRSDGDVLVKEIVPAHHLIQRMGDVARRYSPALVVIGDGTGAQSLMELMRTEGICPLVLGVKAVDEHLTSQKARMRYLEDRRKKGKWVHRLTPLGMQTPDGPYDDYVAVILAERYLSQMH